MVSQVPLISGFLNVERLTTAETFPLLLEQLDEERRARFAGAAPATIPVCGDDPSVPVAFPGLNTFQYFHHYHDAGRSPGWRNECTVRSIDYALAYDVFPYMPRIAPTPLLMILTEEDTTTPTDLALEAFARAREPKRLVMIPGHHYRVYVDAFEGSSGAAREFLVEHLAPR